MPVLNFKVRNLLLFENFEINFSYPTKLRTNLIKDEFLDNIPSFRYKKLNVFYGTNASGKTSIIKMMWQTLLFLHRRESGYILDLIDNKKDYSMIELDIVITNKSNETKLHRFKIKTNNLSDKIDIQVSHNDVRISNSSSSTDSYETKSKILDSMEDNYQDYLEALKEFELETGWNIILPATEKNFDIVKIRTFDDKEKLEEYHNIMLNVFQTLDPAIIGLSGSKDSKDAIVLNHKYAGTIIIQDGNPLSSIPALSSGTKYGINIANLIFAIKHHRNGIYMIDEQFSYISSDIEKAIISKMVSLLGPNEQLFITTHNSDVLSTGFPFHAFYFLKKEDRIIIHCGSEVENRNNVSARTIVDNDLFSIAPDIDKIMDIKN